MLFELGMYEQTTILNVVNHMNFILKLAIPIWHKGEAFNNVNVTWKVLKNQINWNFTSSKVSICVEMSQNEGQVHIQGTNVSLNLPP